MKIVAMSDTHGRHEGLEVPDGDVLIHAGDFCKYGSRVDVDVFAQWFSSFPHEHKIVVAGNHDIALQKYLTYAAIFDHPDYGITYLGDSETTVAGLKFFGSPWTLPFQDWAFMLVEEDLERKYALIPDDVDVLITHGGPAGILDLTDLEGEHAGSQALSKWVDRRSGLYSDPDNYPPLVHIFGHIHERHGSWKAGTYRAFNVSICDFKYNVNWKPTEIEI